MDPPNGGDTEIHDPASSEGGTVRAYWTERLLSERLVISVDEIERELADAGRLVQQWADPSTAEDLVQILYKKRSTIHQRWMDPEYEPKRTSVEIGDRVVTCMQHDEDKVVYGTDDKNINVYYTKTRSLEPLQGHEGAVWALKYTGNTLVSGSTDGTLRVWNLSTGKCTHVFRGHTGTVRSVEILQPVKIGVDAAGSDIVYPPEPLVVTGSRDKTLIVWKLPVVKEEDASCTDYPLNDNPFFVRQLVGHGHSVRSVSAHGNLIVSGSYDTTVRVWDLLQNGNCVQVLTGHTDRIYSTVLDYSKKICYSGSMDSTVIMWNVETGALLRTLTGHTSLVGLLEVDSQYLVSAAADSTVRVWNPDTGENYSKLEGHSSAITCFQHDQLRIVSGSERVLKLWDITSGSWVKDLLSGLSNNWQVRFDYGRCIAAVCRQEEHTTLEIMDFSEPLQSTF